MSFSRAVLQTVTVEGSVTDMSAKVIWSPSEVGVPSFWLVMTMSSATGGEGVAPLKNWSFLGNTLK